MMMVAHIYAITLAFFLDVLIGDPPTWPHPVKWMGTLIDRLDNKLNTGVHKKRNGIMMLLMVLLLVFVVTGGVTYLAYQLHCLLQLHAMWEWPKSVGALARWALCF